MSLLEKIHWTPEDVGPGEVQTDVAVNFRPRQLAPGDFGQTTQLHRACFLSCEKGSVELPVQQGFPLTVLMTFGQMSLCPGGHPGHCRILSSIPCLHPLAASCIPLEVVLTKMFPDMAVPLGSRMVPERELLIYKFVVGLDTTGVKCLLQS